jgi:DNA-binding transcriptional ArsR family regulator
LQIAGCSCHSRRLVLRQPQVSKHLRVLSEAGLVEVRPLAQLHIYRLQAKPFEELDSWVETFRRLWESRLDTLDEVVQQLKQEQQRDKS